MCFSVCVCVCICVFVLMYVCGVIMDVPLSNTEDNVSLFSHLSFAAPRPPVTLLAASQLIVSLCPNGSNVPRELKNLSHPSRYPSSFHLLFHLLGLLCHGFYTAVDVQRHVYISDQKYEREKQKEYPQKLKQISEALMRFHLPCSRYLASSSLCTPSLFETLFRPGCALISFIMVSISAREYEVIKAWPVEQTESEGERESAIHGQQTDKMKNKGCGIQVCLCVRSCARLETSLAC